MSETPIGRMRIYGCGGGGTSIVKRFLEVSKRSPEPYHASLHPVFIDTSRSSVTEGIDETNSYYVKGTDGSGGIRGENYEAIESVVKEVLHQHPPLDFNVVVFTASGGSGSVSGPMILTELLARDETVVCVVIGGDESEIATRNSLRTIKTLAGIAETNNKPVVTYYRQNSRSMPLAVVDEDVCMAITALSILASRQIRELDSKDIFNFVNYNRVSSVKPSVAGLSIYGNDTEQLDRARPVTVISIRKNADEPNIKHTPSFLKASYADIEMAGNNRLFFAVAPDEPTAWATSLQTTLDKIVGENEARPVLSSLIGRDEPTTKKGFVL